MQLTVSRENLILALNRAQGIVGKKTTMPILTNVLIETTAGDRFSVTASDLDIFSKGEYEAIVDSQGVACVNAKQLHDIARLLPPGNVSLELKDNKLEIRSGRIMHLVPTTTPEDYPSMPEFGEIEYFKLERAVLKDMLDHTLFSVANDDPRIFLNGINFEALEDGKLRFVSTDGHRLSKIDATTESELPKLERSVIIPRKGAMELRKLLDEGESEMVELAFQGANGFFKEEDLLLVMRLIEGDFPDYDMVIPKATDKKVRLNRALFTDALKRMSLTSQDRSYGVHYILQDGEFLIQSSDPERGESEEPLEVEYSGDKVQIGFNARYFIEAVNFTRSEEIVLELSDDLSPCVLKEADNENFLCVIMPIRIT